jgi:hypothetical protein
MAANRRGGLATDPQIPLLLVLHFALEQRHYS